MTDTYFSISFTNDIKLSVSSRLSFSGEACREFIVSWYEGSDFITKSFKDFFEASDCLKNKLGEKE